MDVITDELDESVLCAEFQQLGQIIEELHDFSFTNSTVPLLGEHPYANITCIEFDQKENLLWVANDQGHATSFYRADLTPYSKFWWSLDKTDLIANDIITTDAYVIFVGKLSLFIFTRGGVPVLRHKSELIKNINCAHWSPNSPRFLYFGGEQNFMGVFELNLCREIKEIETEDDCCLIRSTDRFLISVNKNGQITVRNKDFNQYKVVAKVVAHNAGIEDIDVLGNYLICCGNSTRQNSVTQADSFMKVYDVRNLGAQAPIGFSQPPKKVRFVPGIEGCVCVSTGFSLFMVDLLNNKVSMFVTFDLPSDSIAISNSGQAIAAFINNYSSYLQIFCNNIDPAFSMFDIDSVFPIQNEEPFVPFDDKIPLAAVFPLAYTSSYCSDKWSGDIASPHYLYPATAIQENKDQVGTNVKDVRYFKSPYMNTFVSGFNVWCFDDKSATKAAPSKASDASESGKSSVKETTSSREQTPDTQSMGTKVKCASPNIQNSIMHRFQNAAEFVPRAQTQPASTNTKSTEKTIQLSLPIVNATATAAPSNKPEPSNTRLQGMSFEQFRAMAEEVKAREPIKQNDQSN